MTVGGFLVNLEICAFEGKKTFAIGDIHGCWRHLEALIHFINYNPAEDRLIFLGDYIDRGENPRKTIDMIMQIRDENPSTICLMGNHEDIMLSIITNDGRHKKGIWLANGCDATLSSMGLTLYGSLDKIDPKYIQFLRSLKHVYIDEKLGFVFCHAGIDPTKPVHKQDYFDQFRGPMWIREDFINSPDPAPGYRVVFGHTPVKKIQSSLETIYWEKNKIGIDTGILYGNKLTALQIVPEQRLKAYSISKEYERSTELEPEL
jgi:serine/threonine protein phosphatase 1